MNPGVMPIEFPSSCGAADAAPGSLNESTE